MTHLNNLIKTRGISFTVMLYFCPLELEVFKSLNKSAHLCFLEFIKFLKLRNNNNPDALFLLASIYKRKNNSNKNKNNPLFLNMDTYRYEGDEEYDLSSIEDELFKKSAKYGSISGMHVCKQLPSVYRNNEEIKKYDKMIFNYYSSKERFKIFQCKHKVAIMYLRGQGVEYNKEKGMDLYNQVLNFYLSKNDINSLYKIGLMYSGLYTFDLSKAIEFFNKASFKGHKKADEKLTNLLRTHKLIDRKIINWWFIKANQGYDWAQNKVGYFYMNGNKYVKKNYEKAIIWWQLAADQGHCAAQNNLKNIKFNNNEKN